MRWFLYWAIGLGLISCHLQVHVDETSSSASVLYDGYIEPNSLSPEFMKGKYYLNYEVRVDSMSFIAVGGKAVRLSKLHVNLDSVWNVIEKDSFRAFLNVRVSIDSRASYDSYLQVYNLISNFRDEQKSEYAKKRFDREYHSLALDSKQEVDRHVIIHVVEVD